MKRLLAIIFSMRKNTQLLFAVLLVASGCSSNPNSNANLATTTPTQQLASSQPTPVEPTPTRSESRESGDVEIIAQRANLRAQANASSDVVIELKRGDQLILLADGAVGAWYNVRDLASGRTGWIHGNTIKVISTNLAKAKSSPDQNKTQPPSDGNGRTYKNKDDDEIPSPRTSATVPPGASAKCGDGTYSFSRHRQGTCSRHGGVAQWLQ